MAKETIRFAHEACSVCGAFGAFGLGPPARPQINGFDERRCYAHLWPEWTAARPPSTGASSAGPLPRKPTQSDMFGSAR